MPSPDLEDGPARQEALRKNEEEINGCSKREHEVSETEAEKDERGRRWRQLIPSGDPCMENNVEEGQQTYTAFVVLA